MMNIIKTKNYNEASRIAAGYFARAIQQKADALLGLATGDSPIGMYKELIRMHQEDLLHFDQVRTINLDEYKGLSPQNEQSYRYFMNQHLFQYVDIRESNTYVPDGLAADDMQECARYDTLLDKLGPIDVQLLGVGHNGHIGFNEPNDIFMKHTNCVDLTPSTIQANARMFHDAKEVPTQAYTMGILPIMMAKQVVIIVCGSAKASIVKAIIDGAITPAIPASILQCHQNVILIADEEALSLTK